MSWRGDTRGGLIGVEEKATEGFGEVLAVVFGEGVP